MELQSTMMINRRTYRRRRRQRSTNNDDADVSKNSVTNSSDSGNNNSNNNNNNEIVSIPVTSTVSADWILRTAPMILLRHLLYARGLFPTPVDVLKVDSNTMDRIVHDPNGEILSSTPVTTSTTTTTTTPGYYENENGGEANKRQRLLQRENACRRANINPSVRRKQRLALDQITSLCDEWTTFWDDLKKEQQEQEQILPLFILLSLGRSYSQSRELYFFDLQSLMINNNDEYNVVDDNGSVKSSTRSDAGIHNSNSSHSHGDSQGYTKEQKLESILTRKLVSALMDCASSNSLPCRSSRTFRLYFSVGFKTDDANNFQNNNEGIVDGNNHATTNNNNEKVVDPILSTKLLPSSYISHTPSWISRTRLPVSERKKSRCNSQKQSIVTIRFHRRQQQRDVQSRNNGDTVLPLASPESEGLTWMSLPTSVKGYRL